MQPVTRRGVRTRNRLLASAEEVFGELGFFPASVSEICRRAGVGQGTFYLYFDSKTEVFAALIRQIGQELGNVVRDATRGNPGRHGTVERIVRAFLTWAGRRRSAYRLIRQAEFVDEALLREHYAQLARAYAEELGAAMERGEVRRGPTEPLAYGLIAIADFVAMRWILWGEEGTSEKVIGAILDFIARGVVPDDLTAASAPLAESPLAES